MRRGKTPNYQRRDRTADLDEKLRNMREATRQVWIARGHLASHLRAQEEAATAAWQAGATHREMAEASGEYHYAKGYVAPALRRLRRGA